MISATHYGLQQLGCQFIKIYWRKRDSGAWLASNITINLIYNTFVKSFLEKKKLKQLTGQDKLKEEMHCIWSKAYVHINHVTGLCLVGHGGYTWYNSSTQSRVSKLVRWFSKRNMYLTFQLTLILAIKTIDHTRPAKPFFFVRRTILLL